MGVVNLCVAIVIKIVFVIGTLEIGGTERQLVELALGLDRSRFNVSVCALSASGPLAGILRTNGVQVVDLGVGRRERRASSIRRMLAAPRAFVRLARFLRSDRAAIIHGFLFEAYVLSAFAARVAGVPIVISSRRSLGIFKEHRRLLLLMERLANRLTNVVVANSCAVRDDAIRREGLRASKVVVIHNGVSASAYTASLDGRERRALGIAADDPIALYVANLIHYKGHEVLLEAMRRLVNRIPSARLLLAGDGPMRNEIEARRASLGLDDNVILLGVRSDVAALLAAADIVVHPSFQEGFSNAILEAMAAAKPVVATNVGGNSEAVADGETGILVPPRDTLALADAMEKLIADADVARRMGAAGRQRALKDFGMEAAIARYAELYEQLAPRN
jgi:glycosyltransferase involved in cell wall biosynthesis